MVIARAGSDVLLARQNPTLQGHPEDYVRADIVFGASLYAAQCVNCHGAGDGVAGSISAADDPERHHRPRAENRHHTASRQACRPSTSPRRTDRHRRLRSQHERARHRLDQARRRAPGRTMFEGKGECLSATQQRQGPEGARPERHRRQPQRRLARTVAERSQLADDADQPAVRVVTKDGKMVNGRRLNEDTFSVQLRTTRGPPVSSLSPTCVNSGRHDLHDAVLQKRAQRRELADVIVYLLSLKGGNTWRDELRLLFFLLP